MNRCFHCVSSLSATHGTRFRHVLALTMFALALQPALAQTPPSPGVDSGTEIERRVPTPPAPRPAPGQAIPVAPAAPSDSPLVPFTLAGVVIEGASAIDPARFLPLYAPLIATTVTADDLARLTRAIGETYRAAGFALATAYVPPQTIVAGIVQVRVVEGHVESIAFEGGPGEAAIVKNTMRAITAERPLTLATLERRLLLLNDIPGMRVADARLRALDVARGAYELVVTLRPSPFDALVSLDNRGTRSNGPWQLWGGAGFNFLRGDGAWRVQAGALTNPASPREIRYATAGAQRTLGSAGTMLRVNLSASDNVAGKPQSDDDVKSGSRRVTVGVSHPLLRSRARSLWLGGSFDVLRATEDRFGADWSRDDLRVLRVSSYGLQSDAWGGENALNVEGSVGLDILGASSAGIDRSRSDASGRFAKLRIDALRNQRLFGPVSALLSLSGQAASRSLLASEEFSLGGTRYGRAFEPSVLSGDRAWAGAAELRWANPVQFDDRLETELFAFADTGVVWNDLPGKDPREHLSSAGVGIRLRLETGLRAAAEVATPLDSSSPKLRRQGVRAFVSIAVEF